MSIFRTRVRIIRDAKCRYTVQFRYWFSPVWMECDFINAHISIEEAEKYANRWLKREVKIIQ